jgi:hypothetical protein
MSDILEDNQSSASVVEMPDFVFGLARCSTCRVRWAILMHPVTHNYLYYRAYPPSAEMQPEFTVSSVDTDELYCPRDGTKMTNVSRAAVVTADGGWLVLDRNRDSFVLS